MEIYDALKLAVEELDRQEVEHPPEYRLTASRTGDDWVFWFVFLPATPGRDVTMTVDPRGKTSVLWGI